MPGYVIADVTVTDAETYAEYRALTPGTIEAFGGRFLIRGGSHEVIEGAWRPGRLVLLEFDSPARAEAWYASPDYTRARAIRQRASTGSLVLARGLEAAAGGVYVIACLTAADAAELVGDPARSAAAHGGRVLVPGSAPEVKEGRWPGERTAVLEFADQAAARAWYGAAERRPAGASEAASARIDAVLAEGV